MKGKWLFIAILASVLLTPLESVSLGGEDSHFSLVKLSVLFVFFFWFCSGRQIIVSNITKLYWGLFIYYLFALLFSINIVHSIDRLFLMYLPTVFLCVIIDGYINTKQQLVWVILAYLIGAIILSGYTYYARFDILENAVNEYGERVTALGHDENELSFLLVMGVVMALNFMKLKKVLILKFILFFSVFFMCFCILSTGSRTGLICLLSVFVIYFWDNIKTSKGATQLLLLIPFAVVAVTYLLSYIPDSIVSRLFETRDLVSSGDMSGRGYIWRIGMKAFFSNNFLFGVGYDNFMNMFADFTGQNGRASHNTYLSFLVTGGIVGFVLFIRIIVFIWKECVKISKKSKSVYIFAYYVPLLITMFTLDTMGRRWLFLIGVLIYKWCEVLNNKSIDYDQKQTRLEILH